MFEKASLAVAVGLLVTVVSPGCASGSDTPAASNSTGQTASAPATAASDGVAIDFRSQPDPPKAGDNSIEVTVKQPDDTAITDATVTAVFTMPAMPAMNMPAMKAEAKLTHVEGGLYRGEGQLAMAGTWNVTVTATRDGKPLGRRSFSVVAK